jgi:hypothetical protein
MQVICLGAGLVCLVGTAAARLVEIGMDVLMSALESTADTRDCCSDQRSLNSDPVNSFLIATASRAIMPLPIDLCPRGTHW